MLAVSALPWLRYGR